MLLSPPSWRRGLKFEDMDGNPFEDAVASFMEAWIEISYIK